jgi:hypothetical protein
MSQAPQSPSFSVIVAAWNSSERIVPTVRSILAQTYQPLEVLIVGDGCTDDTGAVLARHFGESVRWHNLAQNRGSQSYPNNAGIAMARGSHVAYMGHDDVWSPQHLARLARVIEQRDPDLAVSGAIFHAPPGARHYDITGLFDDPSTAQREFFPPSSLAHRHDLTDRIGPWPDPREVKAPVDCDLLLRAARAGCSFFSTGVVTVHKFAAGHRYLWYRYPSADEQAHMLERLLQPGGEQAVLAEVEADIKAGADNGRIRYFDFSQHAPGELHGRARRAKGLEREPLKALEAPFLVRQPGGRAALDWYAPAEHPVHGIYRWSGPNPNPRLFIPVSASGPFHLRLSLIAFASEDIEAGFGVDVNDVPARVVMETTGHGARIARVYPSADCTSTEGLKLCLRMPRSVPAADNPTRGRVGLALGEVWVVPGAAAADADADSSPARQRLRRGEA